MNLFLYFSLEIFNLTAKQMKKIYLMLVVYFATLIWSIINPKEGFTCFLEIIPAIIGLLILAFTFKKFRFTDITYFLILIHCIILFVGGHYTYAEVPLFDYFRKFFIKVEIIMTRLDILRKV